MRIESDVGIINCIVIDGIAVVLFLHQFNVRLIYFQILLHAVKCALHYVSVFLFGVSFSFSQRSESFFRMAAENSKWQKMTDALVLDGSSHVFMMGDPEPQIMKKTLSIIKKAPFWFLMGEYLSFWLQNYQIRALLTK